MGFQKAINGVKGNLAKVNWTRCGLTLAVFLTVAVVAQAGPIKQGVTKGMDETSEVAKYVIGGFGGVLSAFGLGGVGYKVVKKEEDWGMALAATIVGLAIVGVAAAV